MPGTSSTGFAGGMNQSQTVTLRRLPSQSAGRTCLTTGGELRPTVRDPLHRLAA